MASTRDISVNAKQENEIYLDKREIVVKYRCGGCDSRGHCIVEVHLPLDKVGGMADPCAAPPSCLFDSTDEDWKEIAREIVGVA